MQIDLTALPDDPAVLQRMLQEVVPELQAENEKLWLLIQRLLRHRYGRRSEKLDLDQLQLALEDEEQSAAESDAAKDAAEPTERRRRGEVANRNRGALPAHLPRYEVVIDIESKECPCCGGALHVIGDDRTEMLDLVPAQLRVKVLCRPRYGCRACEGTVVQAPAPERPIDGGMATEALVAHIVVSKFCDSLPLYRQAQMLKRQGITLDRSTLSAWAGRACWWLTPLYELVLSTVLSTDKVFADETTLPVLEPGRGKTKTGRLWCYAVDDRPWSGPTHPAAAYVYSEDRRGEHPTAHLSASRGILQVDGYAGFSNLVEARQDASLRLAFCWAELAKVPLAKRVECQRRAMRGGRSTNSTPPPSHHLRPRCWHASPNSTRSRPGSAASHPICVRLFVNCEVGRSSRHCTYGWRITCRACRAGLIWRKPCDMCCGIGTG